MNGRPTAAAAGKIDVGGDLSGFCQPRKARDPRARDRSAGNA